MRYHYNKPKYYTAALARTHKCNHPVYSECTLYAETGKGLAVIQQRYDSVHKYTWWSTIDPWLIDDIYTNVNFKEYFDKTADYPQDGIYPTVTVRQLMWALKMKPLKKEKWETVFDRKSI